MSLHVRACAAILAMLLVTAACQAFEGPPGTPGDSTAPGARATPTGSPASSAPLPSAEASPRVITFADLGGVPEGSPVRIAGRVRVGTSTYCGEHCWLELVNALKPTEEIDAAIAVSSTDPPEPNTMGGLGFGYSESDLRLTAGDGTVVRSGDTVALTGTLERSSDGTGRLADVTAIDRVTVTLPDPVQTTFSTIGRQKVGTLVRLTGRLATPFLLSCVRGACGLYLEDPKGKAKSVSIEVPMGTKGERRPTTMWPLSDNFKASDLRVIATDGSVLRAGGSVRVTGWIDRAGSGGATVSIDPIVRIEKG